MKSSDIESALAYLQMTIKKTETKYKDPQLFIGFNYSGAQTLIIWPYEIMLWPQ